MKLCAAFIALTLGFIPALVAQKADTSEASLLAAREAVWRDYFANSPRLATSLTPDFIAMQAGDTSWGNRDQTLARAKASAAAGTRLVSLAFPRNRIERYGPIAIIHSRYEARLESPSGGNTMKGQITEVFRWDGVRWLHSSWHMDFEG